MQLTVPYRYNYISGTPEDAQPQTGAFLRAVARFCPNLEYLDGWKRCCKSGEALKRDDIRYCSLEVWELFCKSCSRLREANWLNFRLTTDFLHMFGRHGKPLLQKMTVVCSNFQAVDQEEHSGQSEPTAPNFTFDEVGRMLITCLQLRVLKINFSGEYIDPEKIRDDLGDSFFDLVAVHCPLLEQLVIKHLDCSDAFFSLRT